MRQAVSPSPQPSPRNEIWESARCTAGAREPAVTALEFAAGAVRSLHHVTHEQERAGVDLGAVEALGLVDGVFVLGEDGGFVGLVGMNFNFHAVDGVRQAIADHEGGEAVVGAIGIEAWDDLGGLVVERDDDLAAVGTDEVIQCAACAFELEGDGLAGL